MAFSFRFPSSTFFLAELTEALSFKVPRYLADQEASRTLDVNLSKNGGVKANKVADFIAGSVRSYRLATGNYAVG